MAGARVKARAKRVNFMVGRRWFGSPDKNCGTRSSTMRPKPRAFNGVIALASLLGSDV